MAPQTSKPSRAKLNPQEDQREEVLQAVLLADSFVTRFKPFTSHRPRCLLPLANTPLIEYAFEFLASAGVQDVFVYCGNHAEQVEEHVNASKWKLPSSSFRNLTILRSAASSVGDVMRDVDNRNLIAGDFILVSGDLVSNLNLEPALAEHRARREKDKNAIMTMVLREAGRNHRTKSRGRKPIFVIDPCVSRCLHYEEMRVRRGQKAHVTLDSEFLASQGEIEVREDLIDCNIDICTPDVLAQWSENFDYQALRTSFLFGVLKDYELNGKTIHTHIVSQQYAARVEDLKAYDAISRDVTGRWAFPLCPDSNLASEQDCIFGNDRIYREHNVYLGRSSVVKNRTLLGAGTSINEGTVIVNSTLGRQCRIGKDVRIEDSYIWDKVTIDNGSVIQHSIVANESTVGTNCIINAGSLISQGVCVPHNVKVPGNKVRHGKDTPDLIDQDSSESDASSNASSHKFYHSPSASSSNYSISTLSSGFDLESRNASRRGSIRSEPLEEAEQNRDFLLEATASILDGIQKGDAADTIFLELNGYRMSVDASQHEVRKAIVYAFLKRTLAIAEKKSPGQAVQQVFVSYKDLLQRVLLDKAVDEKADQVDFLLLVQDGLVGRPGGDQLLLFITSELYDQDVLEEDGVLQWWNDARSLEGEKGIVRKTTGRFVTFLETAEEEDD